MEPIMEQIFVSSVQKELQADRYAVRDFVHGNALLRQFFPSGCSKQDINWTNPTQEIDALNPTETRQTRHGAIEV